MGVPEATKECPEGTKQSRVSPGSALLTPALEGRIKMLQETAECAQQETEKSKNEQLEWQEGDEESEHGVLQKRQP
ncbi:hypothetical protein NDU88_003208 [Pleurodeles waltl]|uniref:Uncharacterized protein n=1 Tax=Pleurodeles waltl TaxID=8319 RepID=A0AAV7MRT6_PLEWA|nr:hypothetical protein NDU88_003208 [Pleurodeles waltl]